MASMLHYGIIEKFNNQDSFKGEGNIEFLKKGNTFSKISTDKIPVIKRKLHNEKINCRYKA